MPYFWILGLWSDYGRGPLGQVSKSRLVYSSSPWNFWSIEHNHALYWKFGTLAGLRSRPQVQMTMGPIQKTFLVLTPFEGALTCSILIAGTWVMLRKAYFLRKGSWLRPESCAPKKVSSKTDTQHSNDHISSAWTDSKLNFNYVVDTQ
jgi:hypothetical protein